MLLRRRGRLETPCRPRSSPRQSALDRQGARPPINVANLAPPQDANYLSVLQFVVDMLKVRHIMVVARHGLVRVEARESRATRQPSLRPSSTSRTSCRPFYSLLSGGALPAAPRGAIRQHEHVQTGEHEQAERKHPPETHPR